jgi:hypothetical protein
MISLDEFAILVGVSMMAPLPAAASQMVTGNGFGFAVVSPETGAVSKFYAHPYCFTRHDPHNPLNEGIETTNFIKRLGWSGTSEQKPSTEYEEDSHVILVRGSDGEGTVFMPFGLQHAALVIDWKSGSENIVRSNYTDPAIFEYWYERQEFLLVDFSFAELYRRLGRSADADAILERIVVKASADHTLFPGEVGNLGSGAYILHVLSLRN